ncbi:MAG TPA: acyltransferase [Gammaproteobacteria bacterium]|nr:acyltransferase [Gammaproteobacteria bacterium]
MNRSFSIYLDGLRFSAALVVLLCHATYSRYTTHFAHLFGPYGHDAVIVFFVLSGYVIGFSASNKDATVGRYAISRSARIYSVVVPAILMTIIVDYIGMSFFPAHFPHEYQFDKLWAYVPFYLGFGTDLWFANETMLSNGPFWSLSYEVWYYALFAGAFYLAGRRRVFAMLAVLLIIGPRQWLLFPIWMAGCLLYFNHDRYRLKAGLARALFVTSIAVYGVTKYLGGFDFLNGWINVTFGGFPEEQLRYSQYFLGDYLIALLVGLNIWSALYCNFRFSPSVSKGIRLAASFTFSLYLFHDPLLQFYSAVIGATPASTTDFMLVLACVCLTVVLLGMFTERRKHVARRLIERGVNASRQVAEFAFATVYAATGRRERDGTEAKPD